MLLNLPALADAEAGKGRSVQDRITKLASSRSQMEQTLGVRAPLSDVLNALTEEATQMRRAASLGERKAGVRGQANPAHRFKKLAGSRSYGSASQLREQGFVA